MSATLFGLNMSADLKWNNYIVRLQQKRLKDYIY